MSDETDIARTYPLALAEWQRPLVLAGGPGLTRPDGTVVILAGQEIVTTSDEQRIWRGNGTYLGGTVDHGSVASAAAMSAIYLQTSCTRGVHPGDTCWRSDLGVEHRCISGHNATAVWRAVGAGNAAVAGAQPLDADLTAIAEQGVSAWGLARMADSGATAAKNALSIVRSDIGDASAAGRNLLTVATPSAPKLVQVNADGSISLVDAPSGGGSALPVARLTRSTQWDFTSMAGIPWQACTTYVGSGLWSSANPSRLYATDAGLWRAVVWYRSANVTAGLFWLNGVQTSLGWREVWRGDQTECWSYDFSLSAGDYVEAVCYSSGSLLATTGNSPQCTWQRIG